MALHPYTSDFFSAAQLKTGEVQISVFQKAQKLLMYWAKVSPDAPWAIMSICEHDGYCPHSYRFFKRLAEARKELMIPPTRHE